MLTRFAIALIALQAMISSAPALAQQVTGCGNLANAFGPFDYRDPVARAQSLSVVETHHFTPDVEALTGGISGTVLGDLDYTLRAFPNHHRALAAVSRYFLRGGRAQPGAAIPSGDCYFKRALAFQPEDPMVRMLYAHFLAKSGDVKSAQEQYEAALRFDPDSPEVNYNAGLFYFGQKDFGRARELARVAYAGGYPLPGLKSKLEEAGEWQEP